jgi:hypothetical protein
MHRKGRNADCSFCRLGIFHITFAAPLSPLNRGRTQVQDTDGLVHATRKRCCVWAVHIQIKCLRLNPAYIPNIHVQLKGSFGELTMFGITTMSRNPKLGSDDAYVHVIYIHLDSNAPKYSGR